MRVTRKYIKIARILASKKLGEISEIHEQELNQWLSESNANKSLHDHLMLDDFSDHEQSIDMDKAWNSFAAKTDKKKLIKINWQTSLKYAAILIAVVATYFITVNIEPEQQLPVVTEVPEMNLPAGTQKAVLYLSDGSQVNLEKDSEKQLQENDGSMIQKESQKLIYQGNKFRKETTQPIYNTLATPKGGEYFMELADGTKVWLNADSKLTYPVNFYGDKRIVSLEGEAYFEVTHDASHPFMVKVNDYDVEVLGTAFNVKAYQNDEVSSTTLLNGEVKMVMPNKQAVLLKPTEQVRYTKATNSLDVSIVNVKDVVSWKTGRFVFRRQPITEIIQTLSRWYDFKYEFEDEKAKEFTFTGNLDRYKHLKEPLKHLESTRKIKFRIEENIVYISSNQ
ncbi:DUF4974 domain-containing protein [Puteibacter caeruleilacunae]|nr:DUF4974 domain-containing protein [Puteibacter caeruleilacunae]